MIVKLSKRQQLFFRASQIVRLGATCLQWLADWLWKEPLEDEPRLAGYLELAAVLLAQERCRPFGHWLDVSGDTRATLLEEARNAVSLRLPGALPFIEKAREASGAGDIFLIIIYITLAVAVLALVLSAGSLYFALKIRGVIVRVNMLLAGTPDPPPQLRRCTTCAGRGSYAAGSLGPVSCESCGGTGQC